MRLWLSLMLLMLGACSTVPPLAGVPVAARDAAFGLNGRLAVRHGEERHSAGLRWQHRAQHDELLLQGPLGITAARISSDPHSASLEQNGKRYEAQDVQALMEQVLGWGLPLPVLHHWLTGQVDATVPATVERDVSGRLTRLQQAGWEVRYLRYADDRADSLPARITVSRDDLQVQLLIDEWEFDPQ